MVVCRECGHDCVRSDFSTNQLRRSGNQTCKDCTSQAHARGRSPSCGHSRSRSHSPDPDDGCSSDDSGQGDEYNADISDIRHEGPDLEGFLSNRGWAMHEDRGPQGVYYRNDDEMAMLTVWYQTGKYRTKLDRGVHPSGENRQMFGPKDRAGRQVIRDIQTIAKDVRHHTNNRYSDRPRR
jgi:hypothetical protein